MRVIEAMNAYENNSQTTGNLGVNNKLFTRSIGAKMDDVYSETDVVTFNYKSMAADGADTVTKERHLVYSYYNKMPELDVYDNKLAVAQNGTISYDAPNNILTIDLPAAQICLSLRMVRLSDWPVILTLTMIC